jgi:flagellar biosynthesis component FlhA
MKKKYKNETIIIAIILLLSVIGINWYLQSKKAAISEPFVKLYMHDQETVVGMNLEEYIKGTVAARGEILCNHYLAIDASGEGIPIDGIKTIEPTFGLPAVWIPDGKKEDAELLGITVVDPTTVLVTHLAEIIKQYSHELLGRQEVKMLIDNMK